ncbi:MATE family efflux transporter [Lacrimispora indolis]|uniref:MATE family efflux transporter n=1 Tax=Lacrimispora indolis TaxID=69825 RepID=UPI00040D9C0A|nr:MULTISPECIES: MATE family efflux transporter [Lachnospiraceae]
MSDISCSIQKNPLESDSIWKLIRKFAIPATISGLVNSLYNIVDQIFIGQSIGPLGNAATNVAFPLVIIMTALSMMIGIGGASQFSLKLGQNDKEKAGRYIGNSIILAVISGVFLAVIVLIFLHPLMIVFGARGDVLTYSKQYTGITAIGIPFAVVSSALSQQIRADGSPRYAMFSILFGAILNTVLDPLFIFTFDMGIQGAALATITGQIVSSAIILFYFRKFRSLKLTKAHFILRLSTVKDIASLGMAACMNQLAVTVVQVVLNNSLGHYGEFSVYGRDIPLACVGIVSKVSSIFTSVMFGISQSCQPIMGFNYGTGNYKRVKEAYKCAATIIVAIGTTAFLCFQLFPGQIIRIFGQGNELYYQFGIRYFRIFLFFSFINGIQILTSSFFSSIGRAMRGTVMSLSRQVFLFLPLVLLLPLWLGIDGILYAGPIADGVAAIIALTFYREEIKLFNKAKTPSI